MILKKFICYGFYSVTAVLILSILVILLFPYQWFGKRIFRDVDRLHKADAIVVLFGDENEDGTGIGRESFRRVIHGVELLRKDYARIILFSGGNPDGAHFMADTAQQLGIPSEQIVIENASHDTVSNWENTYRIAKARQWSSVLLVSSAFHLARAMRIIHPGDMTIYPAAVPYDTSVPPYTRHEIRKSLFYNTGAYLLYKVTGKNGYARIVKYLRH